MSYIDWGKLGKLLIPQRLRYDWHVDWVDAQIKGIKDIHSESDNYISDLDEKSDYSSQVLMLEKRLNDLFDPFHRKIYFTHRNYNASYSTSTTIQVPDYLNYGTMENRISEVVSYYVEVGCEYDFNYYSGYGFTHAVKTYLDAYSATPDDTEIWSVINFYNKIRGHGMWTGLDRIALFSRAGLADTKRLLKGSLLSEAGAGTLDFDRWGVASDGTRYLTTGYNPNTEGVDIKNSASLYYVSKMGSTPLNMAEGGAFDGTNYNVFGITHDSTPNTRSRMGLAADLIDVTQQSIGAFLTVSVAGKFRIRTQSGYIGSEITQAGAASPNLAEFLCAQSNSGTPTKHSTNKLATWVRYKGALTNSQQIALINAVVEYNNLNSR